ncbi:hypothetical protein NKH77_10275 [Streptomyces sp. M19]
MVLDDAHWTDRASLEWLTGFAPAPPGCRCSSPPATVPRNCPGLPRVPRPRRTRAAGPTPPGAMCSRR